MFVCNRPTRISLKICWISCAAILSTRKNLNCLVNVKYFILEPISLEVTNPFRATCGGLDQLPLSQNKVKYHCDGKCNRKG